MSAFFVVDFGSIGIIINLSSLLSGVSIPLGSVLHYVKAPP